MVRIAIVALVVLVALVVVAWQAQLLENPFARPPVAPAPPALVVALGGTEEAALLSALTSAGSDAAAPDELGRTPLHRSASAGWLEATRALLAAGVPADVAAADGTTPLMMALRHARDVRLPILLLNAGADPTRTDGEGLGVLDHLQANPALRTSAFAFRVRELTERPFAVGWPSLYVPPVPGATLSSRAAHWPNANRAYRNGRHEGFDFYDGAVSGTATITFGTPIVSVADGLVVRADHDYVEMDQATYDRIIAEARAAMMTPAGILDRLRGRQVWIEHAGGFITRYAHLASIPAGLVVGGVVVQGQEIGTTGNSGTIDGVLGTREDPHPHVEIWSGETFLGQGLEPEGIFALAGQLFGQQALPPRWGP
jgi:murein DD-endopeptidase MepM/ murein hydrolase activator NlpD